MAEYCLRFVKGPFDGAHEHIEADEAPDLLELGLPDGSRMFYEMTTKMGTRLSYVLVDRPSWLED